MGEVVELKPVSLVDNFEFVADCCRYSENIMSEAAVKKKWRFADAQWERLGSDDKLIEAIEAEKVRRVRSGQQKRERAQVLVVKAPDVLSDILNDAGQSARHRIDSAKTLNDFASNGPAPAAGQSDRFIISIVLSADGIPHTEHFNKSIKPDAHDIDSNDTSTTLELSAFTASATKQKDDGGGNAV
jgi:hypothetical protein